MKSTSRFLLRSLPSLVFASALFVGGCTAETSSDEPTLVAGEELNGKLSVSELAATKAQLRAICNANTTRTDNLEEVRADVDPLVAKLAKHFGTRPAAQKVPLVAGAWRQIWSDYPYPMAPFVDMDLSQVYQVVSADGHYWNLGDSRALGFLGLTGVLRGSWVADGTKLRIQFTNSGFRFGRLAKGVDLVSYADDLESGERTYVGLPGGGPVGISGTLETLYVDGDLRVERGTQDEFRDEDGNVKRPAIGAKYFILDRVQIPAK